MKNFKTLSKNQTKENCTMKFSQNALNLFTPQFFEPLNDTPNEETEKESVKEALSDSPWYNILIKNKFTDDEWKKFCEEFDLKFYYAVKEEVFGYKDTYLNADKAIMVIYNSGNRKLDTVFFYDEKGVYSTNYFYGSALEILDCFEKSCMPEKLDDDNIERLIKDRKANQHFHLFPDNSKNYEKAKQYIRPENELCKLALKQIDEEIFKTMATCTYIEPISVGSLVRRINVVGDGSWSDYLLRIKKVFDTYVTLETPDMLDVYTINTSKSEFWSNFETAENFKDKLVKDVKYLLANIIDTSLVNCVTENTKYPDNKYTKLCWDNDYYLYKGKVLDIAFQESMWDKKPVSVSIAMNNPGRNEPSSQAASITGFITDVVLAYLDSDVESENFVEQLKNLQIVVNIFKVELKEFFWGNLPEELENLFDSANNNINSLITETTESTEENTESEDGGIIDEESGDMDEE